MKIATFFLTRTIKNQEKRKQDSERTFKIKVRSRWTVFEISLALAVTCI